MEIGDRVLVRNVGLRGRNKLVDRWEEDVYGVEEQPEREAPVFVEQQEGGHGRKRTLHRNMLLPVNFLPLPKEWAPRMRPSLPEDTRTETRRCVSVRDTERWEDETTQTDSESDDGDCIVMKEVVTRNPLDPEAEECVSAAWDHASEETSGYMDTPEHTFDMESVDEERDKKTEVSDEENYERKLGENADIRGNC